MDVTPHLLRINVTLAGEGNETGAIFPCGEDASCPYNPTSIFTKKESSTLIPFFNLRREGGFDLKDNLAIPNRRSPLNLVDLEEITSSAQAAVS